LIFCTWLKYKCSEKALIVTKVPIGCGSLFNIKGGLNCFYFHISQIWLNPLIKDEYHHFSYITKLKKRQWVTGGNVYLRSGMADYVISSTTLRDIICKSWSWRTLNQQWVLLANNTKVRSAWVFFSLNCPIAQILKCIGWWLDTYWCCPHTNFVSYCTHFGCVMDTRRHNRYVAWQAC
jgi:hypothetical protein